MRKNKTSSTSSFKIYLKFGFLIPKAYTHGKLGRQAVFWGHFSPVFVILLLIMRRNTVNSKPTSGFKVDHDFGFPVSKKHFKRENLRLKTAFLCVLWHYSPFFVSLSLCMRRNSISSTSAFKTDLTFWLLVPKNIYTRVIRPSKCILRAFLVVFLDFITAHAQKHH